MIHRCPVCDGRQTMPETFYMRGASANRINDVACRSCGGTGVIRDAAIPVPTPSPAPATTQTWRWPSTTGGGTVVIRPIEGGTLVNSEVTQ